METGKVWRTVDGVVDEELLERTAMFIGLVPNTARWLAELNGLPIGDRRIDRALQLLKRQGRIEFDREARVWRAKEAK